MSGMFLEVGNLVFCRSADNAGVVSLQGFRRFS